MNAMFTLLSDALIKKYEAAGFWRDDTIYSLVRGHLERSPESFALRDRFRRLNYRELAAAADMLAADLASHGVKPGDRVSVWLPSRMKASSRSCLFAQRIHLLPSLHATNRPAR